MDERIDERPAGDMPAPMVPVAPGASPGDRGDVATVLRFKCQQVGGGQGAALRETSAAAYLAGSMGGSFGGQFGPEGFKAYRDQLLRDAGGPTDPVEVMLVEQLALAHHNAGRLQAEASNAASPEAAAVQQAAVCRLMAEFRQTALALRTYRVPVAAKHVTVVRQQNVAATQRIAMVGEGRTERRHAPGRDASRSARRTGKQGDGGDRP